MKNLNLTVAIATIGLVGVLASPALADIANSPHNMQTHITDATDQSNGEICVFCHTPHGASGDTALEAPLWNRLGGGVGFSTYDSASVDGDVIAVGSVSMACLGCHDGASNIDVVINAPGSTTEGGINNDESIADAFVMAGFKAIGSDIAGQLQNDHPIGVQYGADSDFVAPQSSGGYNWVDSKHVGQTALQRDKEDMILYNRTYATTNSANQFGVECGSCHDPHNTSTATDDTLAVSNQVNFLRMTNAGSDLCLSCHTK